MKRLNQRRVSSGKQLGVLKLYGVESLEMLAAENDTKVQGTD
jgi:hypothetical protein